MIDLMSATRAAVFRALSAAVTDTPVFDDLPQGTNPPFLKTGTIETDNQSSKTDQTEQLSVEVIAVYRGADRGKLLAMMHQARQALDQRPLAGTGVTFGLPRFVHGAASDASEADGVTFAGILNFDVLAEPA